MRLKYEPASEPLQFFIKQLHGGDVERLFLEEVLLNPLARDYWCVVLYSVGCRA